MTRVPYIVGLTGGIASGKSTVSRILKNQDIPSVDADLIARKILEIGSPGYHETVKHFGSFIVLASGEIDRKALSNIVFNDSKQRAVLNGIMHPKIASESMQQLQEMAQGQAPYVLYEAALLVENNATQWLSTLIVVAAKRPTQLARLKGRDQLNDEEANARIDSQMPLSEKLKVADHVIWNDTTFDALKEQTLKTHQSICEAARRGPS